MQSLTLTLESLKIAKLSSWVPLMGSEFFLCGDVGSFFCDCSSCDLKKTWLPQFLRLLHRMEAAPVVKEGPAFASCHELFR